MIKKKYIIRIAITAVIAAAITLAGNQLYLSYLNKKAIQISENVTVVEMNRMNKVSVEVTADKETLRGKLVCNTKDFSIFYGGKYQIQILEEDGWHMVVPLSSSSVQEIVETNKSMSKILIDINNQKVFGGYLKKGTYRLIVYYGLNEQEAYDSTYNVMDTFEI